jgi:ribosomal protein S18 acetylase RimI-like enzyme
VKKRELDIRPVVDAGGARACAAMMVATAPWTTFGLSEEYCLSLLTDPARQTYASHDDRGVSGFVILDLRGPLNGYINILCVREDRRGLGLGTTLVEYAEDKIFAQSPNAFICASSSNSGARRLYERLGYRLVGVLTDFVASGHDEVLLRKTRGSWKEFRGSKTK